MILGLQGRGCGVRVCESGIARSVPRVGCVGCAPDYDPDYDFCLQKVEFCGDAVL